MRLGIIGKDKAEKVFVVVHNNEATADFINGQAVAYDVAGTVPGNDAKLPATIGGGSPPFLVGVIGNTTPLSGTNAGLLGVPNGQFGLIQVYGFCQYTQIVRQTRAASTDSFQSNVAIAVGDIMVATTNVNGLTRSGASSISAAVFNIVAWESFASFSSSASATSDTRTAITTAVKTFLRLM